MKLSRILILTSFAMIVLIFSVNNGIAQKKLTLTPKLGSSVKLAYGARSVIIDLNDALSGANGSLPGDPPHRYKVLFTAKKGGYLFLVANVTSKSPISDKNATCGGYNPQSMLWIKVDKTLKNHELENEIYQSCSYKYHDNKVKITKTGLTIKFAGQPSKDLFYNNFEPEKGFVLESLFVHEQPKIGEKPQSVH